MSSTNRIPLIDMIRGLSCLGVLLYHVRVDLWIGWRQINLQQENYSSFEKFMAWISIPTPFMGYAVILFFLVSGFCIHYPNTLPNVKPHWKTYFKRRFWRIYPTYLFAIILTSIISYYLQIKEDDYTWSLERTFRAIVLTQNYPPTNGQFIANPSLWTIPLEIEFYILYPIAFLCILKFGFVIVLIFSACVSAIAVLLTKYGFEWVTFTSLLLWPSWLLGAWVASLHRENNLQKISSHFIIISGLVFLGLSIASRLQNWESWVQYGCWTGFYLFLFIAALKSKYLNNFENRFIFYLLTWLGKISFSLYLIHFPFFKLFGYLHRQILNEKPANFLISLFYLIPVIFLAWLFFRYIEEPIHKWSKNNYIKR